jgi:kynurenine formamidase
MSSTNFNTIQFNSHHGTHTECLGHITRDFYSINQALKQFFFMAELVSVTLEKRERI